MGKGKTKYVILGLLTERDLTGYEIKKIVDIRFSFFWNESYGQLYPELKKLKESGFITEKLFDKVDGRDKYLYSITEMGRNELVSWLAMPDDKESIRLELLLKMYFANNTDRKTIGSRIEEFFEDHKRQLEVLDMFEKELLSIQHEHDNHGDVLRVISFGQKVNRAYLEWCEETLKYLGEESK